MMLAILQHARLIFSLYVPEPPYLLAMIAMKLRTLSKCFFFTLFISFRHSMDDSAHTARFADFGDALAHLLIFIYRLVFISALFISQPIS